MYLPTSSLDRIGLAALIGLGLLTGCTGNPHKAAASDYYQAAQTCRAENSVAQKAGSTSADDPAADIVAGINTPNYLKCLNRSGYPGHEVKTDPLLQALIRCQNAAEQSGLASASAKQTTFLNCLKKRGVEGGELSAKEPK